MKEKIDQFCKNYEIQIVDDQKRRSYREQVVYEWHFA